MSTTIDGTQATVDVSLAGLPYGLDATTVVSRVTVGSVTVQALSDLTLRDNAAPMPDSTLVLAIDSSGSMAGGSMYAAKLAAKSFIEQLRPDIKVGLVTFGTRSSVLLEPTTDRLALYRTMGAIRPQGSTALYDAVADAIGLFGIDGERRILILTDGDDSSSRRSLDSTLQLISDSEVRIDAVKLIDIPAVETILQKLVSNGGGRVFTGVNADGLLAAFKESIATTDGELQVRFTLPVSVPSGRTPLTIALNINGESTVVVGDIVVPTVSTPPAERSALAAIAPTTMLVVLAAVLGVSLFLFLLLITAGSDRAKRRRIDQVLAIRDEIRGIDNSNRDDAGTALEALEDLVRPLLRLRNSEARLTLALDGAGLSLSPEQWVLIRIASVVVPPLTAVAAGVSNLALVLAALGFFAPAALLAQRRNQRSREFEAALPDVLMLMASTLRTGFSLDQAIVTSAEQSDGPVAAQLKRCVQEVRLGLPMEVALSRVAERMASRDFAWVVAALQIQRKSGGNLSELLATAAGTVRERSEIRREVLALTAEGRISANVLMSLPFGILAYLLMSQPDYVAPLWSTSIGRLLSGLGVLMLTLGWLSMKKVVQVEV